ncbi:MAG: LPS assembly protein LptD [Pseudomonadota bacterium]
MRVLRVFLMLGALLWSATAAQAQLATLIADRISFGDGDEVIAEGNVEIFFENRRVLAERLIYDLNTDRITFDGGLKIQDEDTGGFVTADAAELTQDFQEGIIQGARYILAEQLQIAAVELNRVDGRYNQLYKAVATSCQICKNGPPLWQIRAERVAHDQEEQQLYFENAFFEVGGVPVFYFPRLRMPDPTLRRATGFLVPQIRNSSTLGVGLKFPYFITLGESADLRIRPYISTKTRTVEARYRRAFSFGSLQVDGAISQDNLTTDDFRAYIFASGRFELPEDFRLNVDLRLVSDNNYLITYDYSTADRLSNEVELTRTRRDEHMAFSIEELRSLRDGEIPIEDTLATLLGRATYERRFQPGLIGGQATLTFDLEGYERTADSIDATQAAACTTASVATTDCVARDVVRAGAVANWRKDWTMISGIQGAVEGQLAADAYWIQQDANFDEFVGHVTPTAAVEFRWPFARTTRGGGHQILEPVMQIAWTDTLGADVPNDDSKLVDFDEGNLLGLSRFPGSDQYERGWRSTVGLSWSHLAPRGTQYSATVGRVFRLEDAGQFSTASGLDGSSSDWLVASQVKTKKLTLTNRSLFDDAFSFSKSETQVAWKSDKLSASGSYVWVVDDPTEGRTGDTNELKFDADYQFARHWTASVNGRYDGKSNEATEAGFGLTYTNECVNVGFTVSRRFTTSTNLQASTDYGLTVSLNGFGDSDSGAVKRTCRYSG